MTFPAIPKTCSPQQARYLRDRLSNTHAPYARSYRRGNDDEPKEVKAARKLIERHEAEQRKKDNERTRKFVDAQEAARKAILFKSPEAALAAVEAYEKLCREAEKR
jgi:hypothetical protein